MKSRSDPTPAELLKAIGDSAEAIAGYLLNGDPMEAGYYAYVVLPDYLERYRQAIRPWWRKALDRAHWAVHRWRNRSAEDDIPF